jgi:uncharacterized protein
MGVEAQLREDLKEAMRARDVQRRSAIRMVLTAIQLAQAENPRDLTDDEVLELIRKEVKRRDEALEMMRAAGRDDAVEAEEVELKILRAYLPPVMGEAEVRALAQSVVDEVGATSVRDLGRVMGALMPQVKGRADGAVVNRVVRDLLSS